MILVSSFAFAVFVSILPKFFRKFLPAEQEARNMDTFTKRFGNAAIFVFGIFTQHGKMTPDGVLLIFYSTVLQTLKL